MKPVQPEVSELYIGFATDLIPHDLVHLVFDEIIDDWFGLAAIATDCGDILCGDLADDTKLDGRGRLPLKSEVCQETYSKLENTLDQESSKACLLEFLDELDQTTSEGEYLQVGLIGSPPSQFRTLQNDTWWPRLSPGFYFKPGKSCFEMSLFDPTWNEELDDLHEFVEKLVQMHSLLGNRKLTEAEFEISGQFAFDEDHWRLIFSEIPTLGRHLR